MLSNNEKFTSEGGYVFISHAHKDIKNVRQIRNILEERGFEPICFYLRCLSDDNEVLDLIKREIDAREWFLLVDSDHARESRWVKTEVEYIQAQSNKKVVTVSLNEPDKIMHALDKLTNNMSVFLLYAVQDESIAQSIADYCTDRDLKVVRNNSIIQAGENYQSSVISELDKVCKMGCFVVLISKHLSEQSFVAYELQHAYVNGANILPIVRL